MPAVPFNLQIPLLAAALSLGSGLALQLLGQRLRRGSLARALVLRSRLSLCLTIALAGLVWWLARQLGGSALPVPGGSAGLRNLVLSIGLVWTLLRCKGELLGKADGYSSQLFPSLPERDRLFLLDVADKLLTTLVLVLIALQVLQLLGTPAPVLAAAGGFGAAAVGFGAKTIVENVLSGISIYINRPFVVGDLIQIPSENLTGTVEAIGWFYSQLRDQERQPLFVPNAIFILKPVINTGRIDNRRLWIDFGLRHEDRERAEAVIGDLRKQLEREPAIDRAKPHVVHVTGYGDAGLELRLLCFCLGADVEGAWDLRQHLLLQIGRTVAAHGAAMPSPVQLLTAAAPHPPHS